MSHVATMKVEVQCLDSLEEAAKELGMELVRNVHTYKWFGQHVGDYPLPENFTRNDLGKCDHVLRIPNNSQAYEIGVCARKDGKPGYQLLWDFWGGGFGLTEKVGKEGGLLDQHYSICREKRHAEKLGYRTKVTKKQNGNLLLEAY